MSDEFGAVTVPLSATDAPIADPCLNVLLGYFKAFINTYGLAAWQAVAPETSPVKGTLTADPRKLVFNERDLPALYLNRPAQSDRPAWIAADWLVTTDTLTLLWVFPPAPQERQNLRSTIINGLTKLLLTAIARERDACYVVPGDTDPTAATLSLQPTAIKAAVATSTGAVSYSGAALNGAIGAGAISPARPFVLTASGAAGNFTVGSTCTVTGINALGFTQSSTLTITGPSAFTTTDEFTSITSVAIGAQTGTGGTFSCGLGAYQGRGSVVRDFTQFITWYVAKWAATTVVVQMADASARTYEALQIDIVVQEKLEQDLTDTTRFQPQTAIDLSYTRSDGTIIEPSKLPDNADG